ncbi:MAG: glycosyl hydrolase [Thermoguttaceae bacterium]
MTCHRLFIAIVFGLLLRVSGLSAADIDDLQRNFDRPPDDARIMMRWWWFGPAVTKAELQREMEMMKSGGIGGFEVQPTYPLALDDEKAGIKNFKFMSPEFLDALNFTAGKAKELGLRMDLTLGSPPLSARSNKPNPANRRTTSLKRLAATPPEIRNPATTRPETTIHLESRTAATARPEGRTIALSFIKNSKFTTTGSIFPRVPAI